MWLKFIISSKSGWSLLPVSISDNSACFCLSFWTSWDIDDSGWEEFDYSAEIESDLDSSFGFDSSIILSFEFDSDILIIQIIINFIFAKIINLK